MRSIVIIILNYNTPEQTVALANQVDRLGYFTVIVDNCSTDDSIQILTKKVKCLNHCDLVCSKTNGGYAKGNNLGINYAMNKYRFDYIAVMNPDVQLLNNDTIENLCIALEEDRDLAGITAVTILNEELSGRNPCASKLLLPSELLLSDVFFFNRFVRRYYSKLEGNQNLVAYVDKIQGCFFIMKKTCFEDIGFFDENTFLYFEEDIIAEKIRKKGYKLGVLLSETIRHKHGVKDGEMQNKNRRIFYNQYLLESKKYYMLSILKASPLVWSISFVIDYTTRKIKDIWS